MAEGYGRQPARIGELEFTYADPAVTVTTEQSTVEHETIDDQIVVQALGRKPDQVLVEGNVIDSELQIVDELTRLGIVELRTERWTGEVIVKSTETNFERARTKTGNWLYSFTLTCLEVDEPRPSRKTLSKYNPNVEYVEPRDRVDAPPEKGDSDLKAWLRINPDERLWKAGWLWVDIRDDAEGVPFTGSADTYEQYQTALDNVDSIENAADSFIQTPQDIDLVLEENVGIESEDTTVDDIEKKETRDSYYPGDEYRTSDYE